ncbi:MAG TPA: hypothetical protein VGO05_00585, partial [Roseiarcus sp.]|nr:hypothetical protein [Roseiarcus sp.]
MGGLAAAKAVAPYFNKVSVLDRDALPAGSDVRPGTPQARHAHALLAGGSTALEALFPGIGSDLLKAGAIKARAGLAVRYEQPGFDPFPQRDLGFDTFCLSRPLLEHVCRQRLGQEPNIELRHRSRVTDVAPSTDPRDAVTVMFEDDGGTPRSVSADLVVDASGRAVPTTSLLDKLDAPELEVTEIGIDQAYATAVFEIPANVSRDWMGLAHFGAPPEQNYGGLIFPIEHERWIVSLGNLHGGALPGEIEGFKAFVKAFRMPTFFDAIKGARQVGEIARYSMPASVRRHFDRFERFPSAMIPLGDSVCRFNPVFGQGMTVAAQEAALLHACLVEGETDLARRFFRAAAGAIDTPWDIAVGNDLRHPQVAGPRPAKVRFINWYIGKLHMAGRYDAGLSNAFLRVAN